jgi:hypothetical protein
MPRHLLSLLTTLSLLVVLPPTLLMTTITYYTLGPPNPTWPLSTLLITRGLRVYLRVRYAFGLGEADAAAAVVVRGGGGGGGKGVEVRTVQVEEVAQDRRVGWAACDQVHGAPVPCFMIRPVVVAAPSATTTTDTHKHAHTHTHILSPATAHERIIIYLVGGGFVSGHPLRSHLVWSVARWTGARVFGGWTLFAL